MLLNLRLWGSVKLLGIGVLLSVLCSLCSAMPFHLQRASNVFSVADIGHRSEFTVVDSSFEAWDSLKDKQRVEFVIRSGGKPITEMPEEALASLSATTVLLNSEGVSNDQGAALDSALACLKHLRNLNTLGFKRFHEFNTSAWTTLCSLTKLRVLSVRGFAFGMRDLDTATLKNLRNLKSLEQLDIAFAADQALTICESLSNLENLTALRAEVNFGSLSAAGMVYLTRIEQLSTLDLSASGASSECLSVLYEFGDLTRLSLRNFSGIGEPGFYGLKKLKNLKALDLGNCHQVGFLLIKRLVTLPLEELYLDTDGLLHYYYPDGDIKTECDFGVDDIFLEELARCKTLKILSLRNQQGITAKGVLHLEYLKDLTALDLSGCSNVKPDFFRLLPKLNWLTWLDVSTNYGVTSLDGPVQGPGIESSSFREHVASSNVTHLFASRRPEVEDSVWKGLSECKNFSLLTLFDADKLSYATLRTVLAATPVDELRFSSSLVGQQQVEELREQFPGTTIR